MTKGGAVGLPKSGCSGALPDANHDSGSQLDTLILESEILNGVLAGKLLDKMSLLNPIGEAQQNKMAPRLILSEKLFVLHKEDSSVTISD